MSVNGHFMSKRVKMLREEIEEINTDMKAKMVPKDGKIKLLSTFVNTTNHSMMEVIIKAQKEQEYGSLSLLLAMQNYLNTAFHNAMYEAEDLNELTEYMILNLKSFEVKIREQDKKIQLVS